MDFFRQICRSLVMRHARAFFLVLGWTVIGLAGGGCGAESTHAPIGGESPTDRPTARHVSLEGLSLALPIGWDGYSYVRAPADGIGRDQRVIQVSNQTFPERRPQDDLARQMATRLDHDGILVVVWDHEHDVANIDDYSSGPLRLGRDDFRSPAFEGMSSGHSGLMRDLRVGGRFLRLFVELGALEPSSEQLTAVNAVLASLKVE